LLFSKLLASLITSIFGFFSGASPAFLPLSHSSSSIFPSSLMLDSDRGVVDGDGGDMPFCSMMVEDAIGVVLLSDVSMLVVDSFSFSDLISFSASVAL
jgi:hypothetical protein